MNSGLDDVVAAETILSDVDGTGGELVIRGYPLDAIAGKIRFEGAIHLLLDGFFDDLPDEDRLTSRLAAARADVFERTEALLPRLAEMPVYEGMRAGLALMPDDRSLEAALRLIAAPAVLTPALLSLRNGKAPIVPEARLHHAEDIVRMLGRKDGADALDTYLVTVCDHGLNASTFAARVVASTRAGLTSSALAGLGALIGPLHGGAPGPVIEMLDRIQAEGDIGGWLARELRSGERLMGFGHRIYRVRDPRADALKNAVRRLPRTAGRLALAEAVEAKALELLSRSKPDRALQTNVEFYTALLLEAVGFPPEAFTCVFAMGRVLGWIAHSREQALLDRLIRPQSRYVGPRFDLAA
jgi:citrate synthase